MEAAGLAQLIGAATAFRGEVENPSDGAMRGPVLT